VNKKLYVGNLPYTVGVDALRAHFTQAGEVVDAVVITDKYSGRSKGFGFVEFATEEMAQKAIEMFNEKDFEGRNIIVNEARPKVDDGAAPMAGDVKPSEPVEEVAPEEPKEEPKEVKKKK